MKQILALIAGSHEPRINVRTYFVIHKRVEAALHSDALLKLSEMGLSQFCVKLRLTHQYNLDQFLLIGFQIREQS